MNKILTKYVDIMNAVCYDLDNQNGKDKTANELGNNYRLVSKIRGGA